MNYTVVLNHKLGRIYFPARMTAAKFRMELTEISWQVLATPAQGWRRARERAAQP